MKKLSVLILALIMFFAIISCEKDKNTGSRSDTTSASAGSEGDEATVTLYNISDYDFTSVAISKSDQNKWSENLITEVLKAGSNTTVKIRIPADKEEGFFEVLAKDAEGRSFEFSYLDLSELTEKGGSISLALTEGGDGFANFSKPYVEPTLTIDSTPTKLNYKVGEEYDPSGFVATYTDIEGDVITLGADDVKFIVSGTVEITKGSPFTAAGQKVVVVQYSGLTQQFELAVE